MRLLKCAFPVAFVLLLIVSCPSLTFGQDFGDAFATADIEIDPDSGLMYASCSLQLDYWAQQYYASRVNCSIYKNTNQPQNVVANGWADGADYAEVDLEAYVPDSSATDYGVQGGYMMPMLYSYDNSNPDECYRNCDNYVYYDAFNYMYYNYLNIVDTLWEDFPGFSQSGYVSSDSVMLGELVAQVPYPDLPLPVLWNCLFGTGDKQCVYTCYVDGDPLPNPGIGTFNYNLIKAACPSIGNACPYGLQARTGNSIWNMNAGVQIVKNSCITMPQ